MNIRSVILDKIDNFKYTPASGTPPGAGVSPVSQRKEISPDSTDIHEMVGRLNKTAEDLNERISFSYHEKTNRVIVRVINSNTNEIVREIPPKDMIRLLEHLQEFMGMFVDESR